MMKGIIMLIIMVISVKGVVDKQQLETARKFVTEDQMLRVLSEHTEFIEEQREQWVTNHIGENITPDLIAVGIILGHIARPGAKKDTKDNVLEMLKKISNRLDRLENGDNTNTGQQKITPKTATGLLKVAPTQIKAQGSKPTVTNLPEWDMLKNELRALGWCSDELEVWYSRAEETEKQWFRQWLVTKDFAAMEIVTPQYLVATLKNRVQNITPVSAQVKGSCHACGMAGHWKSNCPTGRYEGWKTNITSTTNYDLDQKIDRLTNLVMKNIQIDNNVSLTDNNTPGK